MPKRPSPTAIGLFIIGAIILTIVGIAALASAALFDERTTFISFFEESVNGLEEGAPVKFKGVPVGRVTELLIRINLDEKTFKVPVLYEVDLSRMTTGKGTYVNLEDEETLRLQIQEGLRAQLQMQSFVTGQLYVELTYVANPDPTDLAELDAEYPVIPTRPSLLTALGEEADSLVAGLQAVDIGRISRNLSDVLEGANQKLDQLDVNRLNTSLTATLQAFEELARAPELRVALREVPLLTTQFNETLAEVQLLTRTLGGTVAPFQAQLGATNEEMVLTLQTLRVAVEEMQQLVSAESGVGYRLEEALQSLAAAADALRLLAESLERNPDMLIRGKKQPEE